MTDLSPQAQVVWNAYELVECDEFKIDPRQAGLAAALEAAADQVVPEEVHPQVYEDCCDYSTLKARMDVRTQLLAIAAELRGQDQQHTGQEDYD